VDNRLSCPGTDCGTSQDDVYADPSGREHVFLAVEAQPVCVVGGFTQILRGERASGTARGPT
jgi:hypothetical protein